MAIPFDQVSAVTKPLIEESLGDAFFEGIPVLSFLMDRGKVVRDGGDVIQLTILHDDIDAKGFFSGLQQLSTQAKDNITKAEYDWKRGYVTMTVSRHDVLRASGKSAVINLVKAKVQSALKSLHDLMSTQIFSTDGDGAVGISGLRALVDATTVFGGLDPADIPEWAAGEDDAATTTLTLAEMDDMYLNCSHGSLSPDLWATRKSVFRKIKSLFVAEQRLGPAEAGKMGFKYILHNEVPVIWDDAVPGTDGGNQDNHLFALSTYGLYFYVHSQDDFKVVDFGPLATQDAIAQRITFTGELATDYRRGQGKFSNINPNL